MFITSSTYDSTHPPVSCPLNAWDIPRDGSTLYLGDGDSLLMKERNGRP